MEAKTPIHPAATQNSYLSISNSQIFGVIGIQRVFLHTFFSRLICSSVSEKGA